MNRSFIILLMAGCSLTACNYLDIVPDERPSEYNTYQNPAAAKSYLYSCYSKIHNPRTGVAVDKYTAAEITSCIDAGLWEGFAKGNYSPSDPQLCGDYYRNIWTGVSRCYEFLNIVDKTPGINSVDLQQYKAEATLLIAYYHWLSFRAFGPSVIIDKYLSPFTAISDLPERSSVDEVVAFIDN